MELAGLFIQNNPNDCFALAEIAGSTAPVGLAYRVDQGLYAGTTGGMLISEVMAQLSGGSRVRASGGWGRVRYSPPAPTLIT